jgi:hypothetical protein
MFIRLLLASLCTLSIPLNSWGGGPDLKGFVHDEATLSSSLWSAQQYCLSDVICDSGCQRNLELSSEQIDRIKNLQSEFTDRYEKLIWASLGVEPGEIIDDEASRRQQAYRPEMERQMREFEQQLRSMLSPDQAEAAEKLVLRERYRLGGLRAMLASMDVPVLSTLGFERPPAEIKEHLDVAARKGYKDVEGIWQESREADSQNRAKVQEIASRHIHSALAELGEDGNKIKRLLDHLSGTQFNVNPDDRSMSNALKYGLVSAIMNSLDNNRLEFSDEQKARFEAIYRPLIERRNRQTGIDTEVFGIPDKLVGPDLLDQYLRKERHLAEQMRAEMTPQQIEAAELSVLTQRYSQGGVRAVLESSDLHVVSDTRFERPLSEIKAKITDAVAKSQPEIDLIHAEMKQSFEDGVNRTDRIDQQTLNTALRQLGSDGDRLRELMEDWEKTIRRSRVR